MRRVLRSQHLHWVWIEGHTHRSSILRFGMARGSGNDRLMTAVDAVENADRKEKRTAQLGEFWDRSENFHLSISLFTLHACVRPLADLGVGLEFLRAMRFCCGRC